MVKLAASLLLALAVVSYADDSSVLTLDDASID